MMETFKEMREFERYRGKNDSLAYVAVRPAFTKIGALKDASLGGLGFKYTLMGNQKPLSDEKSFLNIDLFVSNNGFYLSGVKCKVAYDKSAENDSWSSNSDIQFRECGLKFDKLTKEQKKQINVFLKHYTAGSA